MVLFLGISYHLCKINDKREKLESSISNELSESIKNRINFDRDIKVSYSICLWCMDLD